MDAPHITGLGVQVTSREPSVRCGICGGLFHGVGPGPNWGHDTGECREATLIRQRERIAALETALADSVRVLSEKIGRAFGKRVYPKGDEGHDHPWSVLRRAQKVLGK